MHLDKSANQKKARNWICSPFLLFFSYMCPWLAWWKWRTYLDVWSILNIQCRKMFQKAPRLLWNHEYWSQINAFVSHHKWSYSAYWGHGTLLITCADIHLVVSLLGENFSSECTNRNKTLYLPIKDGRTWQSSRNSLVLPSHTFCL